MTMSKTLRAIVAASVLAISAASAADAHAQANRVIVDQTGRNNTAGIIQTGQGNSASLRQFGRDNTGAITQSGANNTACLVQAGRGLDGTIVQSGSNLSAAYLQTHRGFIEVTPRLCGLYSRENFQRGRAR